jgi:hypothetical protein
MLNVNTGYKFDPNSSVGSSQLDVNLMALSWRPNDPTSSYDILSETDLLEARSPVNPLDFTGYENGVIWRYETPYGLNTPFDISDELENRYRFLINHSAIATRLETLGEAQGRVWNFRFAQSRTPVTDLDEWFITAYAGSVLDPNYAYRHIATIQNLDRIIDPSGGKMFNINVDRRERDRLTAYNDYSDSILDVNDYDFSETRSRDAAYELFRLIRTTVYAALLNDHPLVRAFAQFAVNVVDMRDGDIDVTVLNIEPNDPPDIDNTFYGFDAQPFISEVAMLPPTDPCLPPPAAVELYNPFDKPIDLNDFVLELRDRDTSALYAEFNFPSGEFIAPGDTYVLSSTDPNTPYLQLCGVWWYGPDKTKPVLDPRLIPPPDKSKPPVWTIVPGSGNWLYLKRRVALPEAPGNKWWIYVDRQPIDFCTLGTSFTRH